MRTQIRGIHRLKPSGAYSAVFSFVHGYRKPSHSRDALVPAWIRCVHDVGSRTRPRTASARTPSRPSRDARSSSSTGSRARSGRRRWSMCSATGGGLASVTPPPERSYTARTCRSRSGRRSTSGGGRGDAKGGVVMSRCRQGSRCTGLVCCEPAGPAAPASTRGKILFPAATLRLCTCVPGQRHQDHPRLSALQCVSLGVGRALGVRLDGGPHRRLDRRVQPRHPLDAMREPSPVHGVMAREATPNCSRLEISLRALAGIDPQMFSLFHHQTSDLQTDMRTVC